MEYTTMQLSRLLGMNQMQIIHAAQTGIIEPVQDAKGRGSSRKYSENNMKQLKVMKILTACKIPLREIGDILKAWNDVDQLISKAEEFHALFCHLTSRST